MRLLSLAVAAKAPRKQFNSGGAGSSGASSASQAAGNNQGGFGGVNVAKMWPAPKWQKGNDYHFLFSIALMIFYADLQFLI